MTDRALQINRRLDIARSQLHKAADLLGEAEPEESALIRPSVSAAWQAAERVHSGYEDLYCRRLAATQ